MSPQELLDEIHSAGVSLSVCDGNLKIKSSQPIAKELSERIKSNKADLITYMQSQFQAAEHGESLSESELENVVELFKLLLFIKQG